MDGDTGTPCANESVCSRDGRHLQTKGNLIASAHMGNNGSEESRAKVEKRPAEQQVAEFQNGDGVVWDCLVLHACHGNDDMGLPLSVCQGLKSRCQLKLEGQGILHNPACFTDERLRVVERAPGVFEAVEAEDEAIAVQLLDTDNCAELRILILSDLEQMSEGR